MTIHRASRAVLLAASLVLAAGSPACARKKALGATAAVTLGDLTATQSYSGELVPKKSIWPSGKTRIQAMTAAAIARPGRAGRPSPAVGALRIATARTPSIAATNSERGTG